MPGRFTIQSVFTAIDRFTKPIAKMNRGIVRFAHNSSRSMKRLDRSMAATNAGLRKVTTTVGLLGAAAGAVGFSIARSGANFEQAITNVGAVSLQSRDDIAALEATALQLGATTKFTATQVAEGMELMQKSGFSTEDTLSGISGVLSAAAASGLELAEVSGHVSNVLKGMNLQTSEAGRVADVLAVASSRTNSTIGTLGESMRNVAATARDLKIPFEEAVAGVALLQDVGLDASVAGSSLNTMLTKMAAPTAAIERQMKQFGITFKDAQGNMLPFAEVLANISKGAERSGGNMDRVAFLAELVGLRGQKAAGNLARLFDSGKFQTLTAELKNSAGAAEAMAAIRMNTLTGDLLKLDSAVEGVKIALFNAEGAPLRELVQGMTAWVAANKELILSSVNDHIQTFKAHLPEIVTWLKRLGTALTVWISLSVAVKAARLALGLFNGVVAIARAAAWSYGVALKALGFILKLNSVRTLLATASTVAGSVATRIAGLTAAMYGAVLQTTIGRLIALKVAQTAATLAAVAKRAALVGSTAVVAAYNAVTNVAAIKTVAFAVATNVAAVGMGVLNAVMAINPFVLLAMAIGVAIALIVVFWPQIKELFSKIWQGTVELADGIKAAFTEGFEQIVATATGLVDSLLAVWEPVRVFFAELWSGVSSGFQEHLGGVLGSVSAIADSFGGLFGSDSAANASGGPQGSSPAAAPQVVSPTERLSREIIETRETSEAVITMRDETGRAEITQPPTGRGMRLQLQATGAF